jgi:hypothetical protein
VLGRLPGRIPAAATSNQIRPWLAASDNTAIAAGTGAQPVIRRD